MEASPNSPFFRNLVSLRHEAEAVTCDMEPMIRWRTNQEVMSFLLRWRLTPTNPADACFLRRSLTSTLPNLQMPKVPNLTVPGVNLPQIPTFSAPTWMTADDESECVSASSRLTHAPVFGLNVVPRSHDSDTNLTLGRSDLLFSDIMFSTHFVQFSDWTFYTLQCWSN